MVVTSDSFFQMNLFLSSSSSRDLGGDTHND